MHTLLYFLREAVRGLVQARLVTVVAILTSGVSLFVAGLSLVAAQNLRWWFHRASDEVRLVAFVADSVSAGASRIEASIAGVRSLPEVESVTLITKDEARRRFTDAYGSVMLAAVETNPLPASLEVQPRPQFRSAGAAERLMAKISLLPGIEGVTYLREWLEGLERLSRWVMIGSIALALGIAAGLYFMIANTIKLTIYARRELVSNMRMVGATDFYIELPFVIEGMIQGLLGAVLAVALLLAAGAALSRTPLVWNVWYVHASLLGAGLVFGWIGSTSAVRKFLD